MKGADTSKVHVTKAKVTMQGIEYFARARKKEGLIAKETKSKVENLVSGVRHSPLEDRGDTAWKREILFGRK